MKGGVRLGEDRRSELLERLLDEYRTTSRLRGMRREPVRRSLLLLVWLLCFLT